MTDTLSVIFMGTPGFAVPTLEAIHDSTFHITHVITQPDRPKGRGRKLAPPPVKSAALDLGYPVLQPENISDAGFIDQLTAWAPDFLVVIAFGQILPTAVLSIPKFGAINVHASLLPKFRGPAPIQWAIMRGEKTTGVTTMLMDHGVDTGDMLQSSETLIEKTDTAATLHDKLAQMGAALLVNTLYGIKRGTVFPHAQKHAEATYAPLLKKENGRISWDQSAQSIDALVRAMTPWPGAYCILDGKRFKVHKASDIDGATEGIAPGTVVPGFPDELRVATGDGVISILEIQCANGKCMSIKQFLHGNAIEPGAVFT